MIENLVMQIQNGADLKEELWKRLKRFIAWRASSFARQNPAPGVDIDDLIQCGYFALLRTIEAYDPGKGSFLSLLNWYLKNCFQSAIGRTEKQFRDPLNTALSLNAPLDSGDPDGNTLEDIIPDSRDSIQEVEEQIYREQLHIALEEALSSIKPDEASVLRSVFFNGRSVEETARNMEKTEKQIKQLQAQGLAHIRTCRERRALERYLDSRTPFYYRVGADTFCRTHESAVEHLALMRESMSKHFFK